MKNRAIKYIDENSNLFYDVSHKVWEYAELSLKEFKSAALYEKVLKDGGFEVESGICGIKTAFSGKFGSGKPIIAILGEFDALAGLSQKGASTSRCAIEQGGNGHGCGHNMLGAGALAAAFAIKDYLTNLGKQGTVIFYGCPGEEGGAAKAFMARERLWEKVDAALSWHPGDANEVTIGTTNSCIQVMYKFKGVSAHAAGDPFNGRSALDAVELMNIGVQYLREHMGVNDRVHYAITDTGGISPNVVQANASVLYMVRSCEVADAVALQKRVDKIAEGAAMMTETALERVFIDGCANTLPNHTLECVLQDNLKFVGAPTYTQEETQFAAELFKTYKPVTQIPSAAAQYSPEIKKQVASLSNNGTKPLNDFIVPHYIGYAFNAGSTDVGDVSWLTPTAQIGTVTFPSGCPGHSWQNVSSGITSIGDKGLIYAGKVLACAAIDLFEDSALIEKASAEFKTASAAGYTCPVPNGEEPKAI